MKDLRTSFRNAGAFFWQHPVLWLPVLAADLCKFIFAEVDSILRHTVIVWSMPKSVFGGYGGGASLPVVPIILGGLLERLANVFCLLCYLYAFATLARVVPTIQRSKKPKPLFSAKVPQRLWQTAGWSALACIAVPLGSALGLLLPRSPVEAMFGFALVIFVPALYLLTPVLMRFVQVNGETNLPLMAGSRADFYLFLFGLLTSSALGYGYLQFANHDERLSRLAAHMLPWWLLNAGVSLASSLPYAFAMIGFTLRELPPGLFVYGTLHPERAPEEIRQQARRLIWRGNGSVAGQVRDLGEYPALLDGTLGQSVEGGVFCLPDDDDGSLLVAFDHYEGYDPTSPKTSLFLRELRPVTFPDGHTERHWVYVYNREVPAAE